MPIYWPWEQHIQILCIMYTLYTSVTWKIISFNLLTALKGNYIIFNLFVSIFSLCWLIHGSWYGLFSFLFFFFLAPLSSITISIFRFSFSSSSFHLWHVMKHPHLACWSDCCKFYDKSFNMSDSNDRQLQVHKSTINF